MANPLKTDVLDTSRRRRKPSLKELAELTLKFRYHTVRVSTTIPAINILRKHFRKECMNWRMEQGFSVIGIHRS